MEILEENTDPEKGEMMRIQLPTMVPEAVLKRERREAAKKASVITGTGKHQMCVQAGSAEGLEVA